LKNYGNFSLDGSSHQTGEAAFTPATPHDLHHGEIAYFIRKMAILGPF
jgi:hypothetical protein